MLYVGEGSEKEHWCLLCSLPDFSHFPCYPQSNWALLVLLPNVRACARSRPLWISPTNSPVRLGVSLAAASSPKGVFNQRFEALFPHAGALGCSVCLTPQLFLAVYLHMNVGPATPQSANSPGPAGLPRVLSTRLPVCAPPTGLDECVFFSFLVVRLPYSSIFCQFWVFLFLICCCKTENQDGGVGRHTAPPRTTRRRTTTI